MRHAVWGKRIGQWCLFLNRRASWEEGRSPTTTTTHNQVHHHTIRRSHNALAWRIPLPPFRLSSLVQGSHALRLSFSVLSVSLSLSFQALKAPFRTKMPKAWSCRSHMVGETEIMFPPPIWVPQFSLPGIYRQAEGIECLPCNKNVLLGKKAEGKHSFFCVNVTCTGMGFLGESS